VEKLAKSYENGLREGEEKGVERGKAEGIVIGRREVIAALEAALKKYSR
jgi:flagellar biosynthesis/type III secretory pathway protein FliH